MSKVRSVSVYTLKILMKLVNFRRLKSAVGHDYVNENEVQIEVIYQLPFSFDLKIKFTFRKDLNWQQICCFRYWPNGATEHEGDRRRSGCVQRYKTRFW